MLCLLFITDKNIGHSPVNRIQKEIQTNLSPKFTEKKTGARISRFGRPQKQTEHDVNSVPTEISKFISKRSPKRLKPKEANQEVATQQDESFQSLTSTKSPSENKENSSRFEEMKNQTVEVEETPAMNSSAIKENVEYSPAEHSSDGFENDSVDFAVKDTTFDKTTAENQNTDDEAGEGEKEKLDMSDTDSALGSALSCSDEFIAGQILWGSFSRSSW